MPTNKLTPNLVGKLVEITWTSVEGDPQFRIARLDTILREGRVLTKKEVVKYFGKDAKIENHLKVTHDLYVFNVFFEPWLENGIKDSYNIIWSKKAWEKRGCKTRPYNKLPIK